MPVLLWFGNLQVVFLGQRIMNISMLLCTRLNKNMQGLTIVHQAADKDRNKEITC